MFRRISCVLTRSFTSKYASNYTLLAKYQMNAAHTPRRFFTSSLPNHQKLGMPLLSPTMTHGTIVKWLKKEGDKVKAGEIMFEVETDKATLGFEVQDDVYLAKILEPEGSASIALGHPVAILVDSLDDIDKFKNFSSEKQESKPVVEETKTEKPSVHYNTKLSPAAHNMVLVNQLDPTKIKPTGPKGLLLKSDVLEYLNNKKPEEKPVLAEAKTEEIPKKAETPTVKRTETARAPRFSVTVECRLDKIKQTLGKNSLKAYIIKCAALTCLEIPEANGIFYPEFSRLFNYIDIRATSVVDGKLQSYIVQDAHRKRLPAIDKDLATPSLSDFTFEISFLDDFAEVQNPTTAALLTVGSFQSRLVLGPNGPE